MTLMLFISAFTIMMFSTFQVSFRLANINRVVINTPNEIFQYSIPVVNTEVNHLHFDKVMLENSLKKYYDQNLEGIFNNYIMELFFYNSDDDSICTSDECNSVEVTIKGNYVFYLNYLRTIRYEIQEGAKYGS